MKKISWKGSTLLAPMPPVMVSCGSFEESNIITIAWTGIVNTHPPMTYISVRPSRHSYNIIKETGEFAINLTPAELVSKYTNRITSRLMGEYRPQRFSGKDIRLQKLM